MRLMIAELELDNMPAINIIFMVGMPKTKPLVRMTTINTKVLQRTATKRAMPNCPNLRKLNPIPVENIKKMSPS